MEPRIVCRTVSVSCRAIRHHRAFTTTPATAKSAAISSILPSVKAGKGDPPKIIPTSFHWAFPTTKRRASPSSKTTSILSMLEPLPPPPPVDGSPPIIKSWEDIHGPRVAPARPDDKPPSKQRAQTAGNETLASLIDLKADVFTAKAHGKGVGEDLRPTPRKRVSSGRTVQVRPHRDVMRCFNLLAKNVRSNNIKSLEIKQRFHERPGLKRKRLRSERWKETFRQGFQHAIKRVQTLKKMGW